MILDERGEFCDATSVIKTAGASYLIGDVIDLEAVGYNVGVSDIRVVIQTDTEVITAGSAGAIRFHVCSDAQAAIAVDGSQTTHVSSASLVTDDAAANSAALNAGGTILDVMLPRGTYERYLGIVVEVTTTDTTAGKVNAFLVLDSASWRAYPDAQN